MSRPQAAPFHKVLIANRGEIAVRVIQACRELGIQTVAVYSEADTDAMHVLLADEAYLVGPAAAAASYLNIERILEVAQESGAEAIHPGYGFLAENSAFVRACIAAGIVFIGPPPEAMEAMGGKISARQLAETLGVPVVPGESAAIENEDHAHAVANRVGYPLAIKASAGGGGRGLKVVREPGELPAALESAQREGQAYFKDATVFIERYVQEPRHVEVQILADAAGNVVSLGQRDCSVQRQHQKLIEEAPANIPAAMSQAMDAAATRLVAGIGYSGAGTLEFLVDGDDFYFLEMNTRIQVEHTVTEMVTGIDLVQAQIRVAAGEPLWLTNEDIVIQGHAIECRINAEDPAQGFRPAPAQVTAFRAPTGYGIRLDSAVYPGYTIPSHYDSMVAKLIAWAEDRDASRKRMLRALDEMILQGPPTTIPFHQLALQHPDFVAGTATTGFVSRLDMTALAGTQRALPATATIAATPNGDQSDGHGVKDLRTFQVRVEGKPYTVEVGEVVALSGKAARSNRGKRHSGATDGAVTSPMHGVVIRVPVEVGAVVERGTVVCVIEAMKMENEILAPHDGTIADIEVKAGDTVDVGASLLRVQPVQ
ncbi:MAG: acetyl-CoA carboxylase, biotin carboxylase [Chloroflexi bacterium]|nr:acetyl-CoA carboxylase, biotin carboxylase [Chloroflexota bacterium]